MTASMILATMSGGALTEAYQSSPAVTAPGEYTVGTDPVALNDPAGFEADNNAVTQHQGEPSFDFSLDDTISSRLVLESGETYEVSGKGLPGGGTLQVSMATSAGNTIPGAAALLSHADIVADASAADFLFTFVPGENEARLLVGSASAVGWKLIGFKVRKMS